MLRRALEGFAKLFWWRVLHVTALLRTNVDVPLMQRTCVVSELSGYFSHLQVFLMKYHLAEREEGVHDLFANLMPCLDLMKTMV